MDKLIFRDSHPLIERVFLLSVALAVFGVLAACGGRSTPAPTETASAGTEVSATKDNGDEAPSAVGGAAAAANVREDGSFKIVATTTQAADIVTILSEGVDNVQITPLMGAGVDPHLYQPTESDVAAMNEADMVIYSGLHLEGQFDAVFEALGEQGTLIHALSKLVRDGGFTIGGFTLSAELTNVDDPHFWFDPRNWDLTTIDLAEQLATIDPENKDIYLTNADAFATELDTLYAWADEGMGTVADGQRYLVTSHDAFQYFGAAFGWQMAAIQGMSTADEAGVGDIQGVVNFVIDNEIPTVFVESSIPPDTIEAVIEAVASEGGDVRVGVREMYSDAMGEPGAFGGTYVGMIAENVYTVLQSYQCAGADVTIPEWPQGLSVKPSDELLNVACD